MMLKYAYSQRIYCLSSYKNYSEFNTKFGLNPPQSLFFKVGSNYK
jgi:hypothetical protein